MTVVEQSRLATADRTVVGRPLAIWLGGATALMGALVWLAWSVGLVNISRVLPRESSALMFAAAGVALVMAVRARGPRPWHVGPALIVLAIALFSAVDQVVFGAQARAAGDGGGISPLPTAVSFIGVGLALLQLRTDVVWRAYVPTLGTGLIVLVGLCGYALGMRPSNSVLAGMSPVSLVGLAVLTIAILSRWPQLPPFSWVVMHTSGARLARRLVPAIVALPLLLGFIASRWENVTGLDADAGSAVVAAVMIVALTTITAVSVRFIDRAELRVAAERDRAQAAVRESEKQFRTLALEMPVGVVRRDELGVITFANDEALRIFGLPQGSPYDELNFDLVHPDDRQRAADALRETLETGLRYQHEIRILHAGGEVRWVLLRGACQLEDDGTFAAYLSTVQDITEQRRAEQAQRDANAQLEHLAQHDSLTGLLNRRGLETQLWHQASRVQRYGAGGALLLLDLDGFKAVNDALGHAVGDELLVGVGEALASRLRESDTMARLGGDEFAVLLPEGSGADAIGVAEQLVVAVREQAAMILAGRHGGDVTVSVGVAVFDPALSADEVLIRADRAMYEAKKRGKNCVSATTAAMRPAA